MDITEKRARLEAAVENYRRQGAAGITASTDDSNQSAGRAGSPPEPIAIVGLSGYLPQCMSIADFWQALDEDRPLLEEIPTSRFDWRDVYSPGGGHGRSVTKWGGFIPDIRGFDAAAFGILPGEADVMDPQQRMLLMSVYNTFEDAGYAPDAFRNSRTGVFIGVERNEYLLNLREAGIDTGIGLGQSDSMLANRLSYVFDLDGPSEIVNTMCSSGAIAIHRAVAAIRSGEIRCAIVGAANIILRPDIFVTLSQTGQMSPVDTVKSFGADARGYLRGEGVCSVLLKPLAQARADGDAIYAVIRNTAVNYNGRGGTSIAAPSMSRHSELIQRCYREAGVAPQDIGYIEAQGMGNPVADIAEWDAFNYALQKLARERQVRLPDGGCRVSTLKPMTGHMHAASALGSLFKVIRSFKTNKIHQIINFTEINPSLHTAGQPCRLVVETEDWSAQERPRLAGIHSYGSGGSNAHLLIEEYIDDVPAAAPQIPVIIPVSAPNSELLERQVASLAASVGACQDESLLEIAWTMQVGRNEAAQRVAFVASNREAFLGQIRAYLNGETVVGVYGERAALQRSSWDSSARDLQEIARQWVAGQAVVWPRNPALRLRRRHLPVSMFDITDYWIDHRIVPYSDGPALDDVADPAPTAANGLLTRAATEGLVRRYLATALRVAETSVDLDAQFSDIGFDSMLVLDLCAQLKGLGAATVEPGAFFEHTTPRLLIEYLLSGRNGIKTPSRPIATADLSRNRVAHHGGRAPSRDPVARHSGRAVTASSSEREPIAIIGLSGTYPKAADVEQLWANLLAARDCIGEIPADRWSIADHYESNESHALNTDKSYAKWGGFIDGLNEFDGLFFHLSPIEAQYMHPKERLFMQCAWHVLEDAGYTPRSLEGERVGVYVGVSKAGFDNYKDSFFSIANRVSYRFNFTGPSLAIDTACSSSLSAIHEACLHLQTGECSVALVGGVNAYTHPSTFAEFSRLSVMSRDGRSCAFGTNASGFVPGEGVGALMLKPLRQAVSDGDHVYAVIRGTAINHGGKVNGYTVPNPRSHRDVIRLALERAGVNAREISYVEAHGTGTMLGDPIEVFGLTEAFSEDTADRNYCRLGSIKTNIGHLEAAAGIAGVTKVVLQLRHRQLVPSLHSAALNPNIEFSKTPFIVQQQVEDWSPTDAAGAEVPRIACVSSFGAGGCNAHIVVEEYAPNRVTEIDADDPGKSKPMLVVLSAKTEAALRRYVESLTAFLERGHAIDLDDLTYTLQVGREQMDYRFACIAESLPVLLDMLKKYLSGAQAQGLLSGKARRISERTSAFRENEDARDLLAVWFRQGRFKYLAELWVSGEDIDWEALYGDHRPRRVSLPCYPFEKEYVQPADMLAPVKASVPCLPTVARERVEASSGERGTFLLKPVWQEIPAEASAVASDVQIARVILCDLRTNIEHPACIRLLTEERDIALRYESHLVSLFHHVHHLIAGKPRQESLVQIVVPNRGESRLLGGLVAFLKTAHLENGKIIGQLVEVDAEISSPELTRLLADARSTPQHTWIRQVGDRRYVMGWEEYTPPIRSEYQQFSDGGRYLISGGVGGLGYMFAQHIAQQSRHATLVLVGRSELDETRTRKLDALAALGARVIYKRVDVVDATAVSHLMSDVRTELGGLDGILHCAGMTRDAYILNKSIADIPAVLGPKVRGTVNLDRASAAFDLQFFVMFSSAAGAMGYPSQSDYAAANAFMDAYAQQRNEWVLAGQRSGRTVSLDWGLWQDGGMAVPPEIQDLLWKNSGMAPIGRESGIRAFHQGLASGLDQLVVIEGSVERLRANLLTESLSSTRPLPEPAAIGGSGSIEAIIKEIAAHTLDIHERYIDIDLGYDEIGLDPVAFSAIARTLNDRYGLDITPDLFRACASLRAFSEEVWERHGKTILQHGAVVVPGASTPSDTVSGGAPIDERRLRKRVTGYVKDCIAAIIQLPSTRIDEDAPLENYGINSLMILQITGELEKVFGSLSKTLFFEYQTISELTDYFLTAQREDVLSLLNIPEDTPSAVTNGGRANGTGTMHVQDSKPESLASARSSLPGVLLSRSEDTPSAATDGGRANGTGTMHVQDSKPESLASARSSLSGAPLDIAIIGLAGRYPQANNPRQFWEILSEGRDCITEIPAERWDHNRYFDEDRTKPGKTYTKWGGFLDGVDAFDASFFNISPREAEIIEPQERLFLQVAYEAIEDAGYTRQALARQSVLDGIEGSVGVFVGVTYEEYQLYAAEETARGRPMVVSMSPASIANRVSYFCNFHGPSIALDTMCASSLTTIHLACQSLRNQECRVAIAGGVNVSIHPAKYLMLGYGNFASPKGRCQSFGQGGDGFVPSEGVGAVLLKPLAQALADGDHIYGVIKSSAINHGGKTNGYSVPNPKAQTAVIQRALRESGIDPRAISYVEAHGTGTMLGDPIEIAALNEAFAPYTQDRHFCAIGSVKSNIGHCESAAGIAGLTKVLLQFKHQKLVPSLHAQSLNPHIEFARSPFAVQQLLSDWMAPVIERDGNRHVHVRVAGVSSFGAGGSNAHLIVEEPPRARKSDVVVSAESGTAVCIVLSAKTEPQLQECVRRLLEDLRVNTYTGDDMVNLAFTLQVGREAMDERLALIVTDQRELQELLSAFLAGSLSEGLFRGRAGDADEIIRGLHEAGDVAAKTQEWIDKKAYSLLLRSWSKGLPVDWQALYVGTHPKRISLPTYPFASQRYWLPRTALQIEPEQPGASPDKDTVIQPSIPPQTALRIEPEQPMVASSQVREPDKVNPRSRNRIALIPVSAIKPVVQSAREAVRTPVQVSLRTDLSVDAVETAITRPSAVRSAVEPDLGAMHKELIEMLAECLYLEPAVIHIDKPFMDLGLDSIIGVEWVRALNQRFKTDIRVEAVYAYPSIRAFADYLDHELSSGAANPEASTTVVSGASAAADNGHATPGTSGRDQTVHAVETWLRQTLAAALYMDADMIKENQNFLDIGLDSIVSVEWIREVNQHFGTRIETNAVYQYPNIRSFAAMLIDVSSARPDVPARAASLDDLLRQVQQGTVDIDVAEKLLTDLAG